MVKQALAVCHTHLSLQKVPSPCVALIVCPKYICNLIQNICLLFLSAPVKVRKGRNEDRKTERQIRRVGTERQVENIGREGRRNKQASLVVQTIKRLLTMQETQVRSLGWEDPLEKEMAPHSSTLAWKIPWMEEHDRLQFMGSQRVGHD